MSFLGGVLQATFFEEGTYMIQSRYKNFIAFGFDISLLRRVRRRSMSASMPLIAHRCCAYTHGLCWLSIQV